MAMILVPLPRFVLPTARFLFCRHKGPVYKGSGDVNLASFSQVLCRRHRNWAAPPIAPIAGSARGTSGVVDTLMGAEAVITGAIRFHCSLVISILISLHIQDDVSRYIYVPI